MNTDIMAGEVMFIAIEVQYIRTISKTMTPEVKDAVYSVASATLHVKEEFRNQN